MSEQLSHQPVDPIDADHEGWTDVAERMNSWHPGLQEIAKGHLKKRGIEIPAERFGATAIELGQGALSNTISQYRSAYLELGATPESLSELLKRAHAQPELWDDEMFLGAVNMLVIDRAEATAMNDKISSKEMDELKALGIIAQTDTTTKKIFDCETIPGPLVTRLVNKFGIISKDNLITRTWASEVDSRTLLERIAKHLDVLEQLHKHDETAAEEIVEHFGIIHFGRYTAEQLLDQLTLMRVVEAGAERPNSVIAIVSATGDHNGAMSRVTPQSEHQYVIQAGKTNFIVPPVIFIEAWGTNELGDTLYDISQKVAPISTLFIYAHGNESTVYLSSRGGGLIKASGYGFIEHLRPQKSMTPGAEVCLQSCSTGAEYGIADKLSENIGRPVYAASRSTYGISEPFAFNQDKSGDWHYAYGFAHSDNTKELGVGHVFGSQDIDESIPSTAESAWRGAKKMFRPWRPARSSHVSRIKYRQRGAIKGTRTINVHD